MKKSIALVTSILFVAFSLFGCNNGDLEESLDNSSNNSNNISEDSNDSTIEELENEIAQLESQLDSVNSDKELLSKEIEDLDEEIEAFKNNKVEVKTIKVKDDTYIYWNKNKTYGSTYSLSIKYPDETEVEISELDNIWTLKVSPAGTKVIFNDFEGEYTAHVYMYDVEKRETKELLMPELPRDTTASNMEWLDDRYFLFVVQRDHGTIVAGGDVYVYDTETGEYKPIIVNENPPLQTWDMYPYADHLVVFESYLDNEESPGLYEDKYHILTYDEIYDLIENDETMALGEK